jgi:hypothetical protein
MAIKRVACVVPASAKADLDAMAAMSPRRMPMHLAAEPQFCNKWSTALATEAFRPVRPGAVPARLATRP